jgi:hypothetical protein
VLTCQLSAELVNRPLLAGLAKMAGLVRKTRLKDDPQAKEN